MSRSVGFAREEDMRTLVVVIVLMVGGLLPCQGVASQETFPVTVTVYAPTDQGMGDPCLFIEYVPYTVFPWPQLIATSANGVIVGYLDLEGGEVTTIDGQDDPVCAVSADMDLTASPFYTFAIEGAYRRTVSDDVLEDLDHRLYVAVF
jgi:hypothetical protein